MLQEICKKGAMIWGCGREGIAALETLRLHLPTTPLYVYSDSAIPDSEKEELTALGAREIYDGLFPKNMLSEFDLLIRSPGVSVYREEVAAVRDFGIPVISPTSLWFYLHPTAKTICITGTKGKSTVSALTAHLLKKAGKSVALGGNIGLPLLTIDSTQQYDYYVIELSSYQIADLQFAKPEVALITNLYPEHLNWHLSLDNYYSDKLRLLNSSEAKLRIINGADVELSRRVFGQLVRYQTKGGLHSSKQGVFDKSKKILSAKDSPLPGEHNLRNICASASVLQSLGIPLPLLKEALQDFTQLPNRLEEIAHFEQRTFINDSISTIPEATIAALETFPRKHRVLIVGGFDRGLSQARLIDYLTLHRDIVVIGLPTTGHNLVSMLKRVNNRIITESVQSMSDAVNQALSHSRKNSVILLSPGAPSFSQFRNYEERGKVFCEEVALQTTQMRTVAV